ncbi:MAG: hypothetical protein KC912_21360 [Proteobacteria bacterium]|nr:hypothetical protein [Pseudomonadota bacterium]
MLSTLLFVAAALASDPAVIADDGVELISEKRDTESFRSDIEPILNELGSCTEHTNGQNYGEFTLSFMIDKRGRTANPSVRSNYLLTKPLKECLSEPLASLRLGSGDVAIGKVRLTLP